MATLSEMVSVLKAIPQGKEFVACCPAHDDHKPSLYITDKHGPITFRCMAGCTQRAVAAALADLGLWGSASNCSDQVILQRRKSIHAVSESYLGKLVATYDYTDEYGELLYQVMRFDPKEFRQRQPTENGGWIYNLNGISPVLYRMPEVKAASLVILVEGEKDAETVESFRHVGTCNSGGSNAWKPHLALFLRDKTTVVMPDNDTAGGTWLWSVLQSFEDIGCLKNIRTLILPGESKDISEWRSAGGNADQFSKMLVSVL